MDFTQSVFLPLPTFEKTAYANLSTNVADWVHDITKMVYDKLPFITQFPTRIKLERVDEQRGYGYGSIKVGDKLDVPLIIKSFELQPMDVFIYQGKFYPLSERRVEEILFNPEVFGQPSDVSGLDQSIYPSNYPPHSGKYTYASVRLLDKLDKQVTKEDKENFLGTIAESKAVFASFKDTGNLSLVKKAAELKTRTVRTTASVLPVNVLQIEKTGEDKFTVRMTSDRIYDPKEVEISKQTLWNKFGAEVAREVLDKGVFTTIQGTRPTRPVLFEDLDGDEAKTIKSMGKYQVMDIDGNRRVGWVYPNVVDFDLKKTDDQLFTDGLTYAMQDTIVGIEASSPSKPEDLDGHKASELMEGRTGSFVFSRGGGSLATVPFSVTSPIFDQGTHIRFEASDIFGHAFIVEITSGVKSITRSKHQYNVYHVPADAKFVEVGRRVVRLQDSTKDHKVNADAIKMSAEKDVIIITTDDREVFNLAGSNLKELAADARGIGHTKAKWHLVTLGMKPVDADAALERARVHGTAKVIGTKPLLTAAEKLGQVLESKINPLLARLPNMKMNLVKEASVIDDEQIVDKVLSLNFLTPENVSTFMTFLPALEDAASKLAQILIAVRIGMKRIPETAAKSAMMGMETVIAGLRSSEALEGVHSQDDSI